MAESSAAAPEGEEKEEAEKESGLRNAVDTVPYMLHVLLVFVITWLFLPITFYGFIVFCLFIVHLVQVERRGREIDRRGIASEERRKLNTRRTFDEGETSRWLNEGVKSMWPVCMEKFASKHFFGPMAPHFLDKYRPTSYVREAKLNIESLHLGKTPPVFNFIRALEKPLDDDHVAYEAEMDFCSSDDMKAEMTVLLTYAGWKTTFYISHLRIHGKVRISVKFLKGWPVVGRVRFCFASAPVVTMSYKPFYQSFPDVSLFSGVEKYVDGMVKRALEDSVVQPNILEVNIEALASILSSDSQGALAPNGLKVEEKFTLLVEILEARDLKAADRNGLSDPFVNIGFGQQKKKTKVKRKTLTPKWENEQHQFNIINWNLPNFVTLRVQDWDRFRPPTDLGILSVPLNDMYRDGKELNESGKRFEFGKRYEFWKPLEKVNSHEKVTGDLRYAITVNHGAHPRAFEEPRTSDAGHETTATQEITQSSAIDYAVYNSPLRSTSTEMKRSKSDTNLKTLDRTPPKRPKHKSKQDTRPNTPPENSSALQHTFREALHEQAPIGEIHDPITMPYGPLGAFRIIHPGSLQAPGSRTKTKTSPAQPPPNLRIMDHEGAEAPVKQPSGLRTRLAGFVRKRRPSQESFLADSTVSEHSGSLGSIDNSTDLKNLDDPVNLIAPEEPPDMFIRGSVRQLEPIISGKAKSASGAADSVQVSTPHGPDGVQELAASQFPLAPVDHQRDSAHASGELPVPPALPTPQGSQAKPKISSLPKSWLKKIKSLAAKAGRKKTKKAGRDAANGVAYSATELKHHPNGDHDGEVDWVSESFTLESSPLDGVNLHRNNSLGTPGSAAGDSPELRKLMQETPQSRAAGSQSDRSWASKLTQRIRDQSKSLRFDSLHVASKLQLLSPSTLNTIPERPPPAALHRLNGDDSG